VKDRYPLKPEPTDEELVARVTERDRTAFAFLYDRYAKPVYALAAHILGRAEAEEVVQEVFLRLWNRADQFDAKKGPFRAWFMAVARHRVLDEIKRRNRQERLIVAAGEIERLLSEASDPAADAEEEAWLHERSRAVVEALKSLPDDQRRVLILAYFGGLSQSSMAERLGWPLGTVKKRIRLGLQKLRLALLQEGLAADREAKTTHRRTE
jgi:RNA polymerase sigma-70 factor (ECF subfamily)